MKTKIIITSIALLFLVTTAIIYAHRGDSPIPDVEVNALYEFADKNGDGSISKEEFAAYLEARKSLASQNNVAAETRICPETGLPCAGSCGEMCAGGGGGCCNEQGTSGNAPFAESGARKTAFERQTTGGCSGEGCGGNGGCNSGGCSNEKQGSCCKMK